MSAMRAERFRFATGNTENTEGRREYEDGIADARHRHTLILLYVLGGKCSSGRQSSVV